MPSGVSYMLANRAGDEARLPRPVHRATASARSTTTARRCSATLRALAPPAATDPTIVVLTPGVYNSAYFEHAFLAREMGVELVEGRDLLVHDNVVYMRTTGGPAARRRHLPPRRRRLPRSAGLPPDSQLGVAGLFNAYRAGNVVARQRHRHRRRRRQGGLRLRAGRSSGSTCGEEPILPNVETYLLHDADASPVRARAPRQAGGEGGRRIGRLRHADRAAQHRGRARRVPRAASRPTRATTSPSRRWRCRASPCFIDDGVEPRTSTCGRTSCSAARPPSVPGGLTRVALRRGSLVVNSSQGGGSKDTWVLE